MGSVAQRILAPLPLNLKVDGSNPCSAKNCYQETCPFFLIPGHMNQEVWSHRKEEVGHCFDKLCLDVK